MSGRTKELISDDVNEIQMDSPDEWSEMYFFHVISIPEEFKLVCTIAAIVGT